MVAAALGGRGSLAAAVGGVGAAALVGALNGLLVTRARLQPFVVTLATMIAVRGVVLVATHEDSVPLADAAAGLALLGRGRLAGVPVPILALGLAYLAGWAVLRATPFGRHVYAVGDSEEAARLLGLDVARVTVATYALSGALAGFAGLVLAARLGAGQPVAGAGWELDAIAAVVVGGTLLTGGQGGAGATLVGVLLLGVVFNLLNLEGTVSPWWQYVVRGGFLLLVVLVQGRMQGRGAASDAG
jgi:ribose transport system permease protein